nr:type I restriction enzyme endonuclease domain-containing protein [Acinetobacter sp. PW68]
MPIRLYAKKIDELIKLAKTIQESDKLVAELNLTEYEYALYSSVAENESARELMKKEVLMELSVVLTESIRKNMTLDWTIKEAARVKLRVIVKRLLKKYSYPPDMALRARVTVLEQAEQLADELTAA